MPTVYSARREADLVMTSIGNMAASTYMEGPTEDFCSSECIRRTNGIL
jgi:hypothetical protein